MKALHSLLGGLLLVLAGLPGGAQAAFPAAYDPIVVEPTGLPERAEFDLTPALEQARRTGKRLYVYLGAKECGYCRRYEAFLARHADELRPHFAADYLVVDLRSTLTLPADSVLIRAGITSLPYKAFQAAIGDERARMLVYPTVWLLDAQGKPLMQMPSGAGTFQTVPEQIEILRLVQ